MTQLEAYKEKIIRRFIEINRKLNALQDTIQDNKSFMKVKLTIILNYLNNLTSLSIQKETT